MTIVSFTLIYIKFIFLHSVRKLHFAHARIKKHALNQALYTLYEKIVFDTRVRK